ncbi:MAG: RbsD/FucU domain-containing protein [Verrucomicrobiota bacterium]
MLKGIAPCISPDLLKVLAEMGHGDEIDLTNAHLRWSEKPSLVACSGCTAPVLRKARMATDSLKPIT